MHELSTRIAALSLVALTAGCNSVDALTPQVDVGGGTFRSPPVTQSDLDGMSQQTAYAAPASPVQSMPMQNVPSQPVEGGSVQSFGQVTSDTPMAPSDSAYTNPAGTLDAQAGMLSQGQQPAQLQSSAAVSGSSANQNWEGSDDAVVENTPSNARRSLADEADDAVPTQPSSPARTAALSTTAAADRTIRFLPIIGAPVDAVTPLSQQLGAEARARGLTIKASSDQSTQHMLKGYFSAMKDGGKTTVIYVWDVLDGSGNRLHRIQGQTSVAGTAPDLWSAVPAQTMQNIGAETISAYLDWAATQRG